MSTFGISTWKCLQQTKKKYTYIQKQQPAFCYNSDDELVECLIFFPCLRLCLAMSVCVCGVVCESFSCQRRTLQHRCHIFSTQVARLNMLATDNTTPCQGVAQGSEWLLSAKSHLNNTIKNTAEPTV